MTNTQLNHIILDIYNLLF